MIYKSGNIGTEKAVEYVKNMLPFMSKIVSVRAFKNDEKAYSEEVGKDKIYYKCILVDDHRNEFWVDSNCGYPGGGPSNTEKILKLVGIREDLGISNKEIVYKNNLKTNNDLELLVVEHHKDYKVDAYNVLFKIEVNFNHPQYRLKAINNLELIGTIHYYKNDDRFKGYLDYMEEYPAGGNLIQNILFLDRTVSGIEVDKLESLIRKCIGYDKENIKCEITKLLEE